MTRQPDDPGITDTNSTTPMVFGTHYAELTPKVIKKNAGRVPPLTLAQALCWRMKRLQKIAAHHGIDLHFPREAEPRGA